MNKKQTSKDRIQRENKQKTEMKQQINTIQKLCENPHRNPG